MFLTGSIVFDIFSDSSNNSSPPTPPDLSTSSVPLTPTPSPASPQFPPMIDVDQQTDSNSDTALTLAAAGGHDELVTLLLVKGSDIEHRDKKGTCKCEMHGQYQLFAHKSAVLFLGFSMWTFLLDSVKKSSNF